MKIFLSKIKWSSLLVFLVFSLYFLSGLFLYRDYGVSWDEPLQRFNAIISTNYILGRISPAAAIEEALPLSDYVNRDYGVAFDLPVYLLELFLKIDPEQAEVFYLRHLLTFLFFFAAVFFFYRLVKKATGDWRFGLLGSAFLVLSPRIFAESFYNNKDIVFLSAFVIGIYCLQEFLLKRNFSSAFIFGLASALAIDIRLWGLFLPIIGLIFWVAEYFFFSSDKKKKLSQELFILGAFLLSLFFFTVLLWPYLWPNPWNNFLAALRGMANFRWTLEVLYFGQEISALQLPWHYVLVWIGITTPIFYLLLFLMGLGVSFKSTFRALRIRQYSDSLRLALLALGFFFTPLLAIFIFRPVLYNAWRHLYFVYAPIVLLMVLGLMAIYRFIEEKIKLPWWRCLFWPLVFLVLLGVLWEIFRLHPHENVYFNRLVSGSKLYFDGDYWGLSYRAALEYLVKYDQRPRLLLSVNTPPGKINTIFLTPADRARLYFTTPEKADYILTDFTYQARCSFTEEVKAFHAGRFKIMGIYKGGQFCPD